MMKQIEGFSNYYYDGDNVFKNGTKMITKSCRRGTNHYFKLKSDDGKAKSVSEKRVKILTGMSLEMPFDAVKIKNSKDYIDKSGNVYSFSHSYPQGLIKKSRVGTSGYLETKVTMNNGYFRKVSIHQLLAETFIDPDYISKGLICHHINNDMLDNRLDNLVVCKRKDRATYNKLHSYSTASYKEQERIWKTMTESQQEKLKYDAVCKLDELFSY